MCDPGGALTVSTASSSPGADVDVDEAAPVFARTRWARRIDPSRRRVRTIDGDALVAKCERQLVVLTPMVLGVVGRVAFATKKRKTTCLIKVPIALTLIDPPKTERFHLQTPHTPVSTAQRSELLRNFTASRPVQASRPNGPWFKRVQSTTNRFSDLSAMS
jgi:endonuclease YncB( thermonuclease family)